MSFLGTLVWITAADDLLRHRKLYLRIKLDEISLNGHAVCTLTSNTLNNWFIQTDSDRN